VPDSIDHAMHQLSETEREAGMVRLAMVIPTMGRTEFVGDPTPDPDDLPCSGRCGHCNLDPCQLHAPI
jgi:hypothetical protein